jgi:hypothetical protein
MFPVSEAITFFKNDFSALLNESISREVLALNVGL